MKCLKLGLCLLGFISFGCLFARPTIAAENAQQYLIDQAKAVAGQREVRFSETMLPTSPANVMVGIEGTFYQVDKEAILKRINEIRKEAYDEKLVDTYVPIKWSRALEEIAKTRSVESSFVLAHRRLTDKSIWTVGDSFAENSGGENIAWNNERATSAFLYAINQFYEEKATYMQYKKTGVLSGETGHYTSMINPNYTTVGMGGFWNEQNYDWTCVVQRFGSSQYSNELSDDSTSTENGQVVQVSEVSTDKLSQLMLKGPDVLSFPNVQGFYLSAKLLNEESVSVFSQGVHWESSDEKIAQVNHLGQVTPYAIGKVTISANLNNTTVTKQVTVRKMVKAEEIHVSNKSGSLPHFPDKVKVSWSDGSITEEKVIWPAQLESNYQVLQPKTNQVTGHIVNSELSVEATIDTAVVSQIQPLNLSTYSGEIPQLPNLIPVIWSDKSISLESVEWAKLTQEMVTVKEDKQLAFSGVLSSLWSRNKVQGTLNIRMPKETIYRLYNPNSGEHFYTSSTAERDGLAKLGWKAEGIAWYAPLKGDPVYRLYNPNASDHHYTTSKIERENLIKIGWRDEGSGWFSGGETPIYRLYNRHAKKAGAHHYTLSKNEQQHLVSIGWQDELIGWYAVS